MQIKMTIHIPEEQLNLFLQKEGETRESFKKYACESWDDLHLEQDIPGTTAQIEITD
jgi:hypothetical protein